MLDSVVDGVLLVINEVVDPDVVVGVLCGNDNLLSVVEDCCWEGVPLLFVVVVDNAETAPLLIFVVKSFPVVEDVALAEFPKVKIGVEEVAVVVVVAGVEEDKNEIVGFELSLFVFALNREDVVVGVVVDVVVVVVFDVWNEVGKFEENVKVDLDSTAVVVAAEVAEVELSLEGLD